MLKRAAIAFLVVVAIFAVVAVGALVVSQNATNAACEEANDVRTVLTRVLSRSKILAAQNPDYSPAEKDVADDFYTEALNELKTHHC